MTMKGGEVKSEVFKGDEAGTELPVVKAKRPFDVAFLMLPDEKLKQKQSKISKYSEYEVEITRTENSNSSTVNNSDEDEEIEVDAPKIDYMKMAGQKYFTQKQQIFGDPQIGKPKTSLNQSPDQKSAFTKVTLATKDSTRLSPNPSISPDLTYQNSLSPSPPITPRNYQQNFHPFKQQQQQSNPYHNFTHETFNHSIDPFILKSPNPSDHFKMRPMLTQYRPEMPYNYTQFQPQDVLKMTPDIRNPAAAILSSLLPPSLAALSLPAQNVCAKCNISFRMTSDLVYHMRSHHKNDTSDYNKRKREEKLKCPVCAESFRERHHLTRHMTAHQDKDNDADEPDSKKKAAFVAFAAK